MGSSLMDPVITYDSYQESIAYLINQGRIFDHPLLPYSQQDFSEKDVLTWSLISGATLWAIWKIICHPVFKRKVVPPAETIKEAWAEIIYSIRSQYDDMT